MKETFPRSRAAVNVGTIALEPLPEAPMRSDITNVVYVSYLVPAEREAALVPPGLERQRLGPEGKHALFTFLTFQHACRA